MISFFSGYSKSLVWMFCYPEALPYRFLPCVDGTHSGKLLCLG